MAAVAVGLAALSSMTPPWLALLLFAAIVVVCLVTYLTFWLAVKGTARISPLALKLVTRLMGLLLAAVAVQFVINALMQLGVIPNGLTS